MVEKDNEDEYEVSINELKGLTDKVLEKLNYQDQNERNIISDTLLYAQLRGNSQGVVKLITGGVPKRNDQIEDYQHTRNHTREYNANVEKLKSVPHSLKEEYSKNDQNSIIEKEIMSIDCTDLNIYVLFGRAGAGKSTLGESVLSSLRSEEEDFLLDKFLDEPDPNNLVSSYLLLDLDVCIPSDMKENFTKGIYPNIEERSKFAHEACYYVNNEIDSRRKKLTEQNKQLSSLFSRPFHTKEETLGSKQSVDDKTYQAQNANSMTILISFSFVNEDLRNIFRSYYPGAHWLYIETPASVAYRRIDERKGHFSKNKNVPGAITLDSAVNNNDDTIPVSNITNTPPLQQMNSDWTFAKVNFPHFIVNGKRSIVQNTIEILRIINKTGGNIVFNSSDTGTQSSSSRTNSDGPPPLIRSISSENDTPLTSSLNGNQICGMLVMYNAVELCRHKCKFNQHGISIVTTKNTSSGTGALGYWAKRIAEEHKLIGIVLSQAPEMVAPHGSYEPIFGTNPIAIGIPNKVTDANNNAEHESIVLDMATSAYPWFGLKDAALNGTAIPSGVAYSPTGELTTDPNEALKGALRVFDFNYKGSNIALMIEILAGALAGGDTMEKYQNRNWGNTVICIDPSTVGGSNLKSFQQRVNSLVNRIKNAKKLDGVEQIFLPGERSEIKAREAIKKGVIKISRKTIEGLKDYIKPENEI